MKQSLTNFTAVQIIMVKEKKSSKSKEAKVVKDTPGRSIAKAITWRFIASGTTFFVTYVIFAGLSRETNNEALGKASAITIIDAVAKILFYYLHERMWTNITWGKFMDRQYWKQRAWKKLYRKMHED